MQKKILDFVSLDSNNLNHQIKCIRQAATSTGCFILKGHSLQHHPQNLMKVQSQLSRFYNDQSKHSIGYLQKEGATRGYYPIGSESGNPNNFENKESFSFGYDEIPLEFMYKSKMVANNIMSPIFDKCDFHNLLIQMNQICGQLVSLVQLSFPEYEIIQTIDDSSLYQSFMRSFKYHPCDKPTESNSLHTDWNLLTLVQTEHPGLQVLHDNQYWDYYNTTDEIELVVNFGDFLSSISKGVIKSPWHRVQMNHQYRTSLIYFYYPKIDHIVVNDKVYNQNRLLGLFVDQSDPEMREWQIPKDIKTMGDMYTAKWKQVSVY